MAYGSIVFPFRYCFEKSVAKDRASPWNLSIGWPATDMYMPAEAEPASSIVPWSANPSGVSSFTPVFGPRTATLSLISWAPFSQMRPPMKTASAPVALMLLYKASYDDAFGSNDEKPATLMPIDSTAFLKFVATPRP